MGRLRGKSVLARAGLWVALLAVLAVGVAGVGGCRPDRPASVPQSAKRIAGGNPRQARKFDVTCKTDGTAYVIDDWDNSLVWSGPVRRGDVVGIDVYGGRITVNGNAVVVPRCAGSTKPEIRNPKQIRSTNDQNPKE